MSTHALELKQPTLLASRSPERLKQLAKSVISVEMEAISAISDRIDANFVEACQVIFNCEGRVIVTGMGKSGHIGRKIAATLASTGTPSFFIHPGEASHGDMGMMTPNDVVIAISNSGETPELLVLLPHIKRLMIPLIAFSGAEHSTLGKAAHVMLNVGVEKEACPLGLAPTSSTTAALVMGDALAVALLSANGFTAEDFALSHPGGHLGRKLLLRLKDVMVTGDAVPKVTADTTLAKGLVEMSSKGLGMTAIVENNKVLGIFTDGDLRRALDKGANVHTARMQEVMTSPCKTAKADMLAAEALNLMEKFKINGFLVVDDNHELVGALNTHQLLRAGVL